jgi:hypothetical protein
MAVANAGVLSGQLEEFRLIELVQALGMGANTGALHVRRSDGLTGVVYFDQGHLVGATELDSESLTFGHVLQQLDFADEAQIEHAYQLQTQDPFGKRIGERLVELGVLTWEQLQTALRTQILWTVRDMALWPSGSYEFHRGQEMPHGVEIRIESQDATMEILRYEHEWEGLRYFLPEGVRTRLRMAFDPPIGHQLLFSSAVWRLISRVNTHHTVRRIATALHVAEVDAARMLSPLVREGLLLPMDAQSLHELPAEVERMSLRNFDLFTLLIELEQDWVKRRGKSKADHLVALARYINLTMRSLENACRENELALSPDTLAGILAKEHLLGVADYQFRIQNNQIDVEDFAAFARKRLEAARGVAGADEAFSDAASAVLQSALAAAFQAINSRVASPTHRAQNQEAWESLFLSFQQPTPTA